MRRTIICYLAVLFKTAAAVAQSPMPESQITLAMLAEVRQLRQELQTAAATIQRVQIVMFRLQVQGGMLQNARQRLEEFRYCNRASAQRERLRAQIEQAETRRRSAQDPAERKASEEMLSQFNSETEELASRERECQVGQMEAETQFRNEEARMDELRDQLDRLDKVLAGKGSK